MSETLTGYSPPQIPENKAIITSTPDDNQAFETWCQLRIWRRLQDRYADLPPEDRILTPQEASSLQKESTTNIEKYLTRVASLQRFFDTRLGIQEQGIIRNYNPVLPRAMFEQLQTEEERKQFKLYEIKQIETALRERYNVATSTVTYDIDEDGKLRSRDLLLQTFEEVLKIGIEYYKQLGSPDVERMQQEQVGILKIQTAFADPNAPLDLKVEVVSGPGLVKDTIFKENFLDRYELLKEPLTGRRIVQMTRFASDLSYEQAERIIAASKPDYFDGRVGPKDEWLLANPIFGNKSEILVQRKSALKEEEFQNIAQEGSSRMRYLVDVICEAIFVPQKVAIALNAVLNGADLIWEKIMGVKDKVVRGISNLASKVTPVFRNLTEEVNWMGMQAVREVAAACGLSGGFSISKGGSIFKSIGSFIASAIGRIDSLFKSEWFCKNCPVCDMQINCEVKPGESCPNPQCRAVRQCA